MTQQNKTPTWGHGYKVEIVSTNKLKPNAWNPNKESDETFEKVKLSIQTNGFVELPQVRQLADGSLEIVNGEHRWKAAVALGYEEMPVINLGPITDAKAKRLTIITNELRGAPEPVLLAALIKDLNTDTTLSDLAIELPMSEMELDSLIKSTTPFDWESTEKLLPDEIQKVDTRPANIGGERRFQLGTLKGNIAAALSDQLAVEFNRSASLLGSANPEIVLRHWLERLQGTASMVDQEIADKVAAQPAPPPKPKRGSKKAVPPNTPEAS